MIEKRMTGMNIRTWRSGNEDMLCAETDQLVMSCGF
jgi:hypothetical protein